MLSRRPGKPCRKLFEFPTVNSLVPVDLDLQPENYGGIYIQFIRERHEEDQAMQLMLAAVATSCVLAVGIMTAASESPGFTATPVFGTAPLAVRFTVGGRPGRFKIDFGDGSLQASLDTVLSQPWITHSYAGPGTYTATLFATASGGADIGPQAVATLTIAVSDLRK